MKQSRAQASGNRSDTLAAACALVANMLGLHKGLQSCCGTVAVLQHVLRWCEGQGLLRGICGRGR